MRQTNQLDKVGDGWAEGSFVRLSDYADLLSRQPRMEKLIAAQREHVAWLETYFRPNNPNDLRKAMDFRARVKSLEGHHE